MTQDKYSTKVCININECSLYKILFQKDNFDIKECTVCKHRYTVPPLDLKSHINSNYGDSYFFDGKAGYPNYLREGEILVKRGKKYAGIVEKIKHPGKMLSVGCAAGFMIKGFNERGWDGKGIEPNESMANFGRTKLGLDIETTSLEEFSTDERFDLVTLFQVIGHFHNLDKSIENIGKILKNDGIVLIESWNMDSLYARILGKHWHEYSPPTVLHWFSKKTLLNIFSQHGFKPVKSGRLGKKISLKHAMSLMEEKSSAAFIKNIFRKVGNSFIGKINVLYPPLDLFWIIFSKY